MALKLNEKTLAVIQQVEENALAIAKINGDTLEM